MYDCYLNVGMLRGDLRQPPAQKDAAEFFKTMDRFIQRYLPNDAKVRTIYVTLRERMLGQHDKHVPAEELGASARPRWHGTGSTTQPHGP